MSSTARSRGSVGSRGSRGTRSKSKRSGSVAGAGGAAGVAPSPGGDTLDGGPSTSTTATLSQQRSTMKKLFSKAKLGAAFEDVPESVLDEEEIDLSVWSVLATDDTMRTVAAFHTDRTTVRLRRESVEKLEGAGSLSFTDLTRANIQKQRRKNGPVKRLRLSGATKITDAGLKACADAIGHHLIHLEVDHCTKLTDIGLRAAVLECTNLQTLHVDGLVRLDGAGLAAAAASCSALTSLSMAKCRQLDEWMYQALAEGCPELRFINLSQCDKLTDEALKAIARGCPRIRKLDLRDCKAISDVGLLQVSNHCPDLEFLDVSRKELAYKVTDIALLALGERCHALSYLNLKGCNFITDIGLNWLAGGCHNLTYLNLSGLYKVTDTALLTLAEGCQLLKFLSLASLKKLSDLGLRFLSQGCRQLENLDLTGIFLITDGKARDFGLEGLQALCQNVSTLTSVRLAGCYNVGRLALQSFGSGCPNLKNLNLSLCPNVDASGLGPLMKGCTHLETICLRGCDNIDDASLRAVASNAPQLREIVLIGCEMITDAGVAALVRGSRALRKLDLTGCIGVSDLSLLAIAEAKMNPGLRTLILHGCYDCTDTGVSWLAERCPTLTSLNVFGCTVSRPGLRAMMHAWKYVSLRDDESWLGPAPADRANDLKFIEEYGEQWKAAQKMQTIVRGRRARRQAARMREENLRNWVIERMQAFYRRRQAKKAYYVLLMRKRQENHVATKLQTRFRMKLARRRADAARQDRWVRKCHESALKIQRIFRGHRARDLMRIAREARARYFQACTRAAKLIQRHYRGRLGRKEFMLARAALQALEKKKHESMELLTRIARGKLGRMRAQKQRIWVRDQAKREEWAALLVQRHVRGLAGKRVLQRLRQDEALRNQAALWIQSRWRARKGRLAAHLVKQARTAVMEERAALRVQTQWRARTGRFAAFLLRRARAQHEAACEVAAGKMQRIFRGHQARKRVKDIRANLSLQQLKLQDLFAWAAVTIQRHYRGHHDRNLVKEKRLAFERRWKEMWDDESGRPFYYDKNTGEIRWRRPQHLLNQLPKPMCDNCEEQFAAFECKDCGEFFCVTCWPQVHFGGKRKQHYYRPLYDAYDHRIDYGDGEWPSVWPSEIHQDEFIGWKLASEPIRPEVPAWDATGGIVSPEPKRRGGLIQVAGKNALERGESHWVKYEDDSGWPFYYNEQSGETTYDRPYNYTTPRYEGQALLESGQAGWAKHWDDTNQTEFYYNESTGETSWERPLSYATPRYTGQSATDTGDGGWAKYWDDAQQAEFYYNEHTGETSWERPASYATPRHDEAHPILENGPGSWSKYWDDTNQVEYYYNHATMESTYERPVDFQTPRPELEDGSPTSVQVPLLQLPNSPFNQGTQGGASAESKEGGDSLVGASSARSGASTVRHNVEDRDPSDSESTAKRKERTGGGKEGKEEGPGPSTDESKLEADRPGDLGVSESKLGGDDSAGPSVPLASGRSTRSDGPARSSSRAGASAAPPKPGSAGSARGSVASKATAPSPAGSTKSMNQDGVDRSKGESSRRGSGSSHAGAGAGAVSPSGGSRRPSTSSRRSHGSKASHGSRRSRKTAGSHRSDRDRRAPPRVKDAVV